MEVVRAVREVTRNLRRKHRGAVGAALLIVTAFSIPVYAQTTSLPSAERALQTSVQSSDVSSSQMQQFLMARIPPLPKPSSAEEWKVEEEHLRRHILNDVVYHGWPHEWIVSAPHFEQVGVIESGHGYRIRKLRYEEESGIPPRHTSPNTLCSRAVLPGLL